MHRILCLIAVIPLLCLSARAQENARGKGVSLNPYGIVAGTIELRYESRTGPGTSAHAGLRYYALNKNWTAPGLGGGLRWYLYPDDGARALSGFAIGPHAYFVYWLYDEDREYDIRRLALLVGADASYKWVWENFFFEPSISLEFYPLTAADSPKGRTVLEPVFGIHVGFAWD